MTVRRALRLRAATLGAARVLEAVMACMITCWRVCAVRVAARAAPAQSPQSTWRLGGKRTAYSAPIGSREFFLRVFLDW